jgi:hypothetical protein
LRALGTAATNRLIVADPGDYDDGEIGEMMISKGNRSIRKKTCPSASLFTTKSTCFRDANPGRRGENPATNRLSYATALRWSKLYIKLNISIFTNKSFLAISMVENY